MFSTYRSYSTIPNIHFSDGDQIFNLGHLKKIADKFRAQVSEKLLVWV
jgi:hypothetical protein